ncbi:hypothetical protein ACQ4M4_20205 [Leptolyngbya sp. AN02str]|uniref:hypothetical protein n=1 Tax=Leptolyngbya sp. AN02str TaxID=3423363 RepID=UPI003D318EC7
MTISISPSHGQTVPSTIATLDRTILPGERLGPVTRTTTRADLATLFGEAVLEDDVMMVGEGEAELGTTIDLGVDASFTIIWENPERSQIASIMDIGRDWGTVEGIRVGTTLAELKTILGEFEFYGFDWDYGGYVMLDGTKLAAHAGKLILQLSPSEASRSRSPKAIDALSGDSLFKSNNSYVAQLEIAVDGVTVIL